MNRCLVLILTSLWCICFSGILVAQKKNDKNKPNANLILADKHFDNLEYYQAASEYGRVLKEDSSNAYAMFQMAECYRFYYNYRAAEIYYHKVATRHRGTYPLARYWYATMLKDNGDYKKAIENFERYRNENSDTNLETGLYRERALNEIKGCYLAIEENNKPKKAYGFRCLPPPVNSAESDYSPVLLSNDSILAITTSRLGGWGVHEDKSLGGAFSDVQRFVKKNDSIWEPFRSSAKDEFERLNTQYNECSGSFAKNNTNYYFTRCDEIFVVDNYKEVNCAIYVSYFKNERWEEPKRLNHNINAPGQWNSQPSVSPDGNILFFVSKRPGGFGMQDIWFSTCNGDDQWGPPVNAGNGVNTLFSDVSPRYYPAEKVLFFSSNGHGGYGALDIFMTKEDHGFEHAVNIGYPFNSNRDDFYFVLGEKKGYVSSNREGGIGNDDVYQFDIRSRKNLIRHIEDSSANENDEAVTHLKTSREEPIMDIPVNKYHDQKYAHMSGWLFDSLTNTPAKEIEVRIVDEYGEAVAKALTSDAGKYEFYNIPTNKDYNMVLNNPDATQRAFVVSKPKVEYSEKTIVPVLEKEPVQEIAVLREVLLLHVTQDTMKDYKAFIVHGNIRDSLSENVISKGQVQLVDEFGNVVQVATPDGSGNYKIENVTDSKDYKIVYKVTALSTEKFLISANLAFEANSHVPHATDALIALVDTTAAPGAESLTIDGKIYVDDTRKPAPNVSILLTDENGFALKTSRTDKNGYYRFSNLKSDRIYKVILHQGDLKGSEEKKYRADKVNIHASAAGINRQLFDNIYFDFDSYVLRNEAKKALEDLIAYCKGDTTMQIELYANTDSYGSNQYNKILAANRGRVSMEYLVAKGVKQSSIVVNSVGENKFIASNETELGRQLNRRVEFYVVSSRQMQAKAATYVIEANKTLSSLASEYNMTVEELKELNGLVGDELVAYTPVRVRKRAIDIDINGVNRKTSSTDIALEKTLIEKNQSVNKNFDFNRPEYLNYLDSIAKADKVKREGNVLLVDIGYYNALKGNTYKHIAALYGISLEQLKYYNSIQGDVVALEEKVKINYNDRNASVKGYIVREGDTLEGIARRFQLSEESLVRINGLEGYRLSKNMVVRFVE